MYAAGKGPNAYHTMFSKKIRTNEWKKIEINDISNHCENPMSPQSHIRGRIDLKKGFLRLVRRRLCLFFNISSQLSEYWYVHRATVPGTCVASPPIFFRKTLADSFFMFYLFKNWFSLVAFVMLLSCIGFALYRSVWINFS